MAANHFPGRVRLELVPAGPNITSQSFYLRVCYPSLYLAVMKPERLVEGGVNYHVRRRAKTNTAPVHDLVLRQPRPETRHPDTTPNGFTLESPSPADIEA